MSFASTPSTSHAAAPAHKSHFRPLHTATGLLGAVGNSIQGASNSIFDFALSNQEPPPSAHSPYDWSVSTSITHYEQRSGCDLELFCDAEEAWRQLLPAIQQAKHLIYIMGWSVWTDLLMDRTGSCKLTLGQLLKQKS